MSVGTQSGDQSRPRDDESRPRTTHPNGHARGVRAPAPAARSRRQSGGRGVREAAPRAREVLRLAWRAGHPTRAPTKPSIGWWPGSEARAWSKTSGGSPTASPGSCCSRSGGSTRESRWPSMPICRSLSVRAATETVDPLHDCFEACLARLPGEARALVLGYYADEKQAKIDHRQHLAHAAGISQTALRSRVHRLRDRLEGCAERCAAMADARGLDEALRHVSALPDTLERHHSDGD